MFANDYEWYLYGGLLEQTDAFAAPSANSVDSYRLYSSNPNTQSSSGFSNSNLSTGVTQYITYGASVSAPSENLGFYFGGLRAADFGEIDYGTSNESMNADVECATLIQLNMTTQQNVMWSNESLPSSVPLRADAQIVWVPLSEHGILVAIGGVINPVYSTIYQADNSTIANQGVSPLPPFAERV